MYTIPNTIRNKIYEGGLSYTPIVTIGGVALPNSNIKSISRDNPIIDTTSDYFYVGSFVSQKVDIEFQKPDEIDLTQPINYSIKIIDDETSEEIIVPIGVFNVETSPIDYYKTGKLTALDNAVKLKSNFANVHNYFNNETDDISVEEMLEALCDNYGLTLGDYPSDHPNISKRTGSYDNSLSGKQYASWCGEMLGSNVKIDRSGRLTLVPLKSLSNVEINGLGSKSFTIGEKYTLDGVRYDTGTTEHHFPKTEVTGNVLTIRTDNIFITGTDEEMEEIIGNIYESVRGLEIYSITTENYTDISLDSSDIVTYNLGENNYSTFYSGTSGFNKLGKVNVVVPTKNVEKTTNTIETDLATDVRMIKTEVNRVENYVRTEITRTQDDMEKLDDNYQSIANTLNSKANMTDISTLSTQITQIANDSYTKTQINAIITGTDASGNVITYAKAGSATFDINGLTIDDNTVKVKSNLSAEGLEVIEKQTNNEILYVGYDEKSTESIVRSKNINVDKYFVIGGRSRFENYTDGSGNVGTGCFWVGN